MKSCANCGINFNDGVQCMGCKKHLDFSCASVSETTWRKMGSDRRAQWKCLACKSSPVPLSPQPSASLDTVLSEIRELRQQLSSLPTLVSSIKSIKEELIELKKSFEFSSGRLDDFDARLVELEVKASEFDNLRDTVSSLQAEVVSTRSDFCSFDHRTRLNNVEIKGVPVKKNENLFSVLDAISSKINYNCPKTQINYISRVPIHNSKEKLVIVSFLNRYIKDDFIAAARANKELSTKDIGVQGPPHRIYVNDHLSIEYKKLLNRAKTAAKEKQYEFVWVKHGKIHVRKDVNCKTFIVRRESDLNKII
ncbi:uncharacterized protein LOC111362541 [Spodoptera litura]|uniref:Uncharacterized protein LOC111351567 n=1 Tax=Spodoptera litura TaxID=69820 RepID=A0A9J7DW71_SPOLT|nr:uncharacterized protein LOC111351567 [Spodoptera litura]XP_022835002.1 uncharacterized protein LOC111362541 [Spodoptera litura]